MKVQGVFVASAQGNRFPVEVTAAMGDLKAQRTARASFIKPFTPLDMRYYILETVLDKPLNLRTLRGK